MNCAQCHKPIKLDTPKWVHADGKTYRHRCVPEEVGALPRWIWQFNEAVSLLSEARACLTDSWQIAAEIDEALPKIRAALQQAADSSNRKS